jgi:hypothetical protein
MPVKDDRGEPSPRPTASSEHAAGDTTSVLLLDLAKKLEPAAKLATVITAIVGAGLIYVLGGLAMGLRLDGSHFPIEEGLKVVPREVLLFGRAEGSRPDRGARRGAGRRSLTGAGDRDPRPAVKARIRST